MNFAYRLLRAYRGYFLPSHHRAFREALRLGAPCPGDDQRKFVFFDFTNPEVDLDAGRYVFALVREFELNGFTSCYRRHFPFLSNMRYKRCKSLLLDQPFRVAADPSELPPGSLAAIVTDRESVHSAAAKLLQISYDLRLPRLPNEAVLPFKPYPLLYPHLAAVETINLGQPRPWRAFFAGTVNPRYARPALRLLFGKMSRVETLDVLRNGLRPDEFHALKSTDDPISSPKFVLAGASVRIPAVDWFPTLARGDFFLAAPGGAMPICHNVVEAMAVGAIPILEYPEYLDPPLRDGVNCLAFVGPEGLLEAMRRALKMDRPEILQLRRAALAYYREHLAPGAFARKFLAAPEPSWTLLFNAPLTPRGR